MFTQIRNKMSSPEFKKAVVEQAMNVAANIIVAVTVKAVVYVAIEGTKALVANVTGKEESTAAE